MDHIKVRVFADGDRAGIQLYHHANHLAKSPDWRGEAKNQGNGQPVSFYLSLYLAGKVFFQRRL